MSGNSCNSIRRFIVWSTDYMEGFNAFSPGDVAIISNVYISNTIIIPLNIPSNHYPGKNASRPCWQQIMIACLSILVETMACFRQINNITWGHVAQDLRHYMVWLCDKSQARLWRYFCCCSIATIANRTPYSCLTHWDRVTHICVSK